MPIDFSCTNCGKGLRVPSKAAGRKGRCTRCGNVERVPRLLSIESGYARPHHYLFAHRYLPHAAFTTPGAMVALSQAESSGETLRKLWRILGREVPRDDQLSAEGLRGRWVEVGSGLSLALIRMPRTCRMTEAIQIVGAHYRDERGAECFRYFTLELTRELESGGPTAVLCEWVVNAWGELEHLNFDLTLPDSETALTRAVAKVLGYSRRRGCCKGAGVPLMGPALLLAKAA